MQTTDLVARPCYIHAVISPSAVPFTESPDLGRIEELFTAWIEALTAGNSARVARLHVPHGVFQHPGGKGARGRDAIQRACSGWLSGGTLPSLVLFETRLFEPADVATANGRFTIAPGDWGTCAEHARGRLLLVAEKSDERWGLRFSGLFSDAFLRELDELVI
jgi:uncharacterized protein (TIGR02246 family)